MSRLLKDWLDSYLEFTSEDEPPKIFRKWTAISVIAAAMQRKCYHRLARKTFYPNFYIALVGKSATRKSTATELGQEFLQEVGIELAADVTSKEKLVLHLEQIGSKDSLETSLKTDAVEMVVTPHSSLTAIATELSVFFPRRDEDFVGYLIKLYDCENWFKYETIKRGEDCVENVWFNLLGCITPDTLKVRLTPEIVGSGLTGRFIFIFAPGIGRRNAYQLDTPAQKKIRSCLVRDLREILSLSGAFKPDAGWLDAYVPWYEQTDLIPPFSDSRLDAYCGRRGSYIHKLSMIASASRGNDMVLRKRDFERALSFLEEAEVWMPDAVSGIGASEGGRILDDVILYLKQTDKITFTALLKRFMYQVEKQELLRIVWTLQQVKKVSLTKTTNNKGEVTEMIIRYLPEGSRASAI
jgi:hypothetical protein